MSTSLDNLVVGTKSSKLVIAKGSTAFSQVKVINMSFTGSALGSPGTALTTAFANVNFPVKCVNVLQIVMNTNDGANPSTANATGIIYSSLVDGKCIGSAFMNSGYGYSNPGVKNYYVTPKHINGTYDFWITNSAGSNMTMSSSSTWSMSVIVEFIADNSGQMPVTTS